MDNLFDDEMTEIEEKNEFIEKDFEYSNLNIVELNDFLKKDTNNYKDLAGSLCGKIYLLETKLMPEDKSTIQVIENQISYEYSTYEKRVSDLEQQQVPENAGFFAKMSFKKQIDKNLKSHKKTLEVLENRLKKHEKQAAENKEDFLKLTNKLKDKGFFWEEMRKLVEEKIKLGILSFDKSNAEKNKPRVKKIDPREYEELHPQKPKKKPKSESGGSSGSGRDIDFYGDPNYFDISKLSPMEQIEFRKLLGRYNHNRDLFQEYEEAKRIRMSMFAMDRQRELDLLRMQTSDFGLHRFLNNLFGPDRDPCIWCGLCDMWGLPHDTFGFHGHRHPPRYDEFGRMLDRHGRPFDFNHLCDDWSRQLLTDSGHGLNGRERYRRPMSNEIRRMLRKPDYAAVMCNCFEGNKDFVRGEVDLAPTSGISIPSYVNGANEFQGDEMRIRGVLNGASGDNSSQSFDEYTASGDMFKEKEHEHEHGDGLNLDIDSIMQMGGEAFHSELGEKAREAEKELQIENELALEMQLPDTGNNNQGMRHH